MSKGTSFGGPAGAVAAQDDDHEEMTLEELNEALGDPMNDLPPVVRRRVNALQNLQKQYLGLQKQYHAEVRELERKYQKLYEPVFDKRASVLSGAHEPSDEEAHVEPKEEEEEGLKKREATPADAEIKGIPQFWLTVLQNSQVGQLIMEHDEEALEYLRDIRYAELEGEKEGFTLTFTWAENPFFTNTVLTKTYFMEQDELFGELQYDHATSTKVEWKSGKNLTVRSIKKKLKAKGKKPARTHTIEEPQESFFSFFNPVKIPTEEEELSEEDAENMEMDFDVGCIIKDKLIPFSVLWFTGEAAEYEDNEDDDDMFDGEEGEDDEDDDEDDDDDDAPPPPKKGGNKGGHAHPFAPPPGAKAAPGAPGQPQQPECKQQ